MQTDALRTALKQHRLSRGMSYDDLTEDIASALGSDRKLSIWTVRAFIDGSSTPHETTAYAIEQYLKTNGVAA
ncbi:MAG TPA: hypothetical protein VNM92_01665 [Thermoanaerobaculia bacterium]|nr:hypothetical protein [Thermoanaerobaculia bacterium]